MISSPIDITLIGEKHFISSCKSIEIIREPLAHQCRIKPVLAATYVTKFVCILAYHQCDQIWRFIGLWAPL